MSEPEAQKARRGGVGSFALMAFFAVAPAAATAGGLALAPLQALAGLFGAPWRSLHRQTAAGWGLLALLIAFPLYLAVSTQWSPAPASLQPYRLLGGVLCGWLFCQAAGHDGISRRRVRAAGAAAVFMLIALLSIEAFADMWLNRMAQPDEITTTLMRNPSRGAVVLTLLVWGVIGAFAGGRAWEQLTWKLAAAGAAVIAFQFSMDANIVAFVMATSAYIVGYFAFRFALWLLIAGIGGWLVSAPWATPFLLSASGLERQMPDSWQARGIIWRNICDMIYQQPLLGRGVDASRFFTDIVFVRDGLGFPAIPLHPHSASLQIWFEGGAVGVGLVAAILIAIGLVAQRAFAEHRTAGAALCAGMGAVGVFANVSFGAWQEWWIAAIFCAPALALAARR